LEPIPFLNLAAQHDKIRDAVKNAFLRVYDRNWFILGREVDAFETEYAEFNGTSHCISVANGLDAITLALQSAGVGNGDEVIVPAHTYFATWLAITRCGAVPIPVDADPVTYNINVNKISEKISSRTRVILPVHLYGQACNMTTIDELSKQFSLDVVEDNAQSHGAMWGEKQTGSFGIANATSFYPTKNLGALGDGGAVTTFDPEINDFIRRNRNYGFKDKDLASHQGMNSRLDEIQAAVLRIKMIYLEEWNQERRRLARLYLEHLKDTGDLVLPLSDKEAVHVYHLFVIQSGKRDALRNYLAEKGVETKIHYPVPPHLQEAFTHLKFKKGDFPIAEKIAREVLSLPLWPGMTDGQVGEVCDRIKGFFKSN
jgi:dTDP-4-amino-4,6-dideoxygalactose transaminase